MPQPLSLIPRGFIAGVADRIARAANTAALAAGRHPPAQKSARYKTAPWFALDTSSNATWMPRDTTAFAREGFMQNAIVYRSVRMIAEAAASVPILLYDGAHEIEDHPLLRLIAAPTSTSTRADLLEAFFGHLLVSGNAYLEVTALGGELRELHILRPDRIQIVPGSDGYAEAYDYTVEGLAPVRLDGDAIAGVRRVLHQKLFHPLNDHYGFSPIEAASTAIDIHNAASRWNKALLDNSARPSGALVYTSRDGNLTTEQYERLKSELESGFQGAGNAGRPLLLEGGLDWKSMSMSPKDLDFMEAKHGAAREIALALGVPPMLLGIPGDNTFSNYQEANRTFWRQTVLPLVQRTTDALSEWLAAGYGPTFSLKPEIDTLDALSSERDAQWSRLNAATFLTDDEKRAVLGYGPKPTTNLAGQKFNPNHDAQGRFTTGEGDSGGNNDPNFLPAAASPRPPKGPPPSPPPKSPAAPPKAPSGRNQSTDEILKPGGQDIGTVEGRARPNVRTVSPGDFEATKNKLLDGAVEIPPPADYKGKWYQRADGTTVGVRESSESGTTLEVVKGNSKIDSGYKVHKK